MKTQNNLRHILVMLVACHFCSLIVSAKEGVAVFLAPTQELTFGGDTISTQAAKVATGSNGQDLTAGPIKMHMKVTAIGAYFSLNTAPYVETVDSNTYIKKVYFVGNSTWTAIDFTALNTNEVKLSLSTDKKGVTITANDGKEPHKISITCKSGTNRVFAIYVTYETEEPKEPEREAWKCPLDLMNVDATWGEDLNLNDSLNYFLEKNLSEKPEEYAKYAENPPKVIYTITNPNDYQYVLVGTEDDPNYKCVFRVLEPKDTTRCVNIQCSWDESDYWFANTDGGSFTVNILPTEDDTLKISMNEQSGNAALEASGTQTTIGRTGYNLSVNKQADTNYYFYLNDDKENTCELTDSDTVLIRPGNYGDVSVLPGEVYTITVVAVKDDNTSTATTEKFLTQPNIEIEDAPAAEQAVALAEETPTDKIVTLKVAGADTKIYYSIGGTNEAAEQEYTAPVRVNVGEHITYYAEAEGLTSPKVVYAPQDITVSAAVIIDENVAPEYYDMQGRRVDTATPASGIYIRKTLTGTTKIIIR